MSDKFRCLYCGNDNFRIANEDAPDWEEPLWECLNCNKTMLQSLLDIDKLKRKIEELEKSIHNHDIKWLTHKYANFTHHLTLLKKIKEEINKRDKRIKSLEITQKALWKYINGKLTSTWQNKIEQQQNKFKSVLIIMSKAHLEGISELTIDEATILLNLKDEDYICRDCSHLEGNWCIYLKKGVNTTWKRCPYFKYRYIGKKSTVKVIKKDMDIKEMKKQNKKNLRELDEIYAGGNPKSNVNTICSFYLYGDSLGQCQNYGGLCKDIKECEFKKEPTTDDPVDYANLEGLLEYELRMQRERLMRNCAKCPNCAHFETGAINCRSSYNLETMECEHYLPINK